MGDLIVGKGSTVKLGPSANNPMLHVDRGDPAGYDFALSSFTKDGAWHDLDVSAIVPAGALSCRFSIDVQANAATIPFLFRKKGNSNTYNVEGSYTIGANALSRHTIEVPLDANRVFQYYFGAATWATINMIITGWKIPAS